MFLMGLLNRVVSPIWTKMVNSNIDWPWFQMAKRHWIPHFMDFIE
jgi:hypothetical protein